MKEPASLRLAALGRSRSPPRRTESRSQPSNCASTPKAGCNMLSRIIEACARNRFLVFTAVVMLTLAGICWLLQVPLDALPDISDVQVIVHTGWAGQPPAVIEDQVTYPIVTAVKAPPHRNALR